MMQSVHEFSLSFDSRQQCENFSHFLIGLMEYREKILETCTTKQEINVMSGGDTMNDILVWLYFSF